MTDGGRASAINSAPDRVCPRPACHAEGRPQPISEFSPDNTWCRACHRDRNREVRRQQRELDPNNVRCPLCGERFALLGRHLHHSHPGVTLKTLPPGTPHVSHPLSEHHRTMGQDRWLDQHDIIPDEWRWGSPDEIIKAIRAWESKHGKPPSASDWLHVSGTHPTARQSAKLFGSWTNALTAAGFAPRPSGPRPRWSRERIIRALQAEHRRTGKVPSFKRWHKSAQGRPGATRVVQQFGSWRAAVEAAGLTPRPTGRPRKGE